MLSEEYVSNGNNKQTKTQPHNLICSLAFTLWSALADV